ncbi:MAG: hypothetical protein R3B83_03830 [Nitrospirales bacterium]|nr:hypothetical protein [Nitrospirales bacterium]
MKKGHVAYGLNMNVDITPQKAAEECLAAQHRLLQAIIQSSVDPIYAKDRTGKYILINQSAAATIVDRGGGRFD